MLMELIDRRLEDINRRFEDISKRFEDLRYYVDRRIGFLEKLMVELNTSILVGIITLLLKAFMS